MHLEIFHILFERFVMHFCKGILHTVHKIWQLKNWIILESIRAWSSQGNRSSAFDLKHTITVVWTHWIYSILCGCTSCLSYIAKGLRLLWGLIKLLPISETIDKGEVLVRSTFSGKQILSYESFSLLNLAVYILTALYYVQHPPSYCNTQVL